jgi:hypothetical protein
MKIIKQASTGLLCVALLLQCGCAAVLIGGGAAAGVAGYAYAKGELKGTENAGLDKVWDASLGAMKDLQFAVTSQSKDALSGQLTARTAQDKKVQIDLKALPIGGTEIKIRVGHFGDEALSMVVMDKIKQRL